MIHPPGDVLEVEKKFALEAVEPFLSRLESHGFELQSDVRHADQYFNHPCRDFAETGEAFRIRRVDGAGLVTYKGPKREGSVKIRLEDEWRLGGDDATGDRLEAMLITLGFRPQMVVRKRRRTFLPVVEKGDLDGLSVCLDEVADLGSFVEIETLITTDTSPATRLATERIERIADRLSLSVVEPRSYLTQLIEKLA